MPHYRTLWVSDIHLGTRGSQAEQLLDFLARNTSETLYLTGDIFDGWELKKKWYWPESHQRVVQTFLQRAANGTKVIYIPGNHDEVARDYLDKNFGGIPIINQLVHTTAKGQRLLILHGDQFDAVMGYAKWLAKLGSMAYGIAIAINWVFNKVRRAFGLEYWSLSAFLKQKVKGAVKDLNDFEHFLVEEARRNNCTGLVCGHIHRAEIRMIEDVLYCNDGDWVESCTALAEDMEGNLLIIKWREQQASQRGLP